MVANTTVEENGAETTATTTTPRLPPGKYKIVGFDLDLTGRRLIDEICHIGAYTPNSQFSQYVMPFKDLNLVSIYRHLIRVATVGRYRMLKCIKTGEVLKTKSEISAMSDFLQWLENLKAEGIILVTHDNTKTIPPFLLEALRKYKLLDRFNAVVKGFANSCTLAEQKCEKTVKSHSLLMLTKFLLDKSEEVHSAAVRARLSYQIVQHLCPGEEDKGSGDATSTSEVDNPAMSEALRQIATTIADEEKKLAELKELVERQNNLRPIFGERISSGYKAERSRATSLRRLLAEANLSYELLSEAWTKNKKEGLLALVKERITTTGKPEDIEDLIDILLSHFDPEHTPKVRQRRGNRKVFNTNSNKEHYGGVDELRNVETGKPITEKYGTAASSPVKSAGEKADGDTSR